MSTSNPTPPDGQGTSTRPYLIRALHDWCTDNGFTPYVAVYVDESVRVPVEYVKNGEIVLNVGFEATSGLTLGNEVIEFKARFGGTARDIVVPVSHVIAIYARENGQGMAFPVPSEARAGASAAETTPDGAATAGGAAAEPRGLRLASAIDAVEVGQDPSAGLSPDDDPPPDAPPASGRPTLKRVK